MFTECSHVVQSVHWTSQYIHNVHNNQCTESWLKQRLYLEAWQRARRREVLKIESCASFLEMENTPFLGLGCMGDQMFPKSWHCQNWTLSALWTNPQKNPDIGQTPPPVWQFQDLGNIWSHNPSLIESTHVTFPLQYPNFFKKFIQTQFPVDVNQRPLF